MGSFYRREIIRMNDNGIVELSYFVETISLRETGSRYPVRR